jgi:hypothetical protein
MLNRSASLLRIVVLLLAASPALAVQGSPGILGSGSVACDAAPGSAQARESTPVVSLRQALYRAAPSGSLKPDYAAGWWKNTSTTAKVWTVVGVVVGGWIIAESIN